MKGVIMSGGSTNDTGRILGSATTVAGGATLLPNTGSNDIALIVAAIAVIAGGAVLLSAVVRRVLVRTNK